MIIVLDTNIVASATFWRGKPAHCLEAWALGKFELAISVLRPAGQWTATTIYNYAEGWTKQSANT
jgi:hypothetical protein